MQTNITPGKVVRRPSRQRLTLAGILRQSGIQRGSGSLADYEKAKALLRHGFIELEYEKAIQMITDYLKI